MPRRACSPRKKSSGGGLVIEFFFRPLPPLTGLCHDLGHGPFSHLFEHSFIHALDPQSKWRHERASIMMFDHLLESNNLRPVFKHHGLSERDIVFIKEMIYGELPAEDAIVSTLIFYASLSGENVTKQRWFYAGEKLGFIIRRHATLHFAVSVRPVTFLDSERFSHYWHYCSCSTVRDWIAVYPALVFKFISIIHKYWSTRANLVMRNSRWSFPMIL